MAAFLLASRLLPAAGVTVRFDPASPEVGPFPSDLLTISDPAQRTALRVNLPLPDCVTQPSSCRELGLINQLDGFNLQPRIRVGFSGPVNPETLRTGIYLIALQQAERRTIRINQVIYDPATNTAYAESDQTLAPQSRYALIITNAVRDPGGDPVEPAPAFLACVATAPNAYCRGLSELLATLTPRFPPRGRAAPPRIVAASVFTTLSATAWLENARAQIQNSAVGVRRLAPRAVFDVSDILSLTLKLQVRANPVEFSDTTVPLPGTLLAGVGRVAFGSFQSPSFLDSQQMIPPTPTGAPIPLPAASTEILFHVFLPSSPMPASGYPVIVFGHGLNDSSFGAPTLVASTFARAGFATIAINAAGHGSGPLSRLVLILANGSTAEIPAGGRSLDLNGDGAIGSAEGCLITGPIPIGLRDCLRQTALDLMQLVRGIRAGMDLDGDGVVDLDRNRIYYVGQSLGSLYGTVFNALEPAINAAVLNVGGGSVIEIARWSPEFLSTPRAFLEGRTPPLLNRPGGFDENYALRDRPVKINDVPGAIEIQNVFEILEWLQMPGDPIAYAARLKPKPVLWQFAKGDRTVPNPTTSALIRAAGMRQSTQLYRHDFARAVAADLSANPHAYLVDIRSAASIAIALAAQAQIAGFFESGGAVIPNANTIQIRLLFGRNLFEIPETLPEDLNF